LMHVVENPFNFLLVVDGVIFFIKKNNV